MNDLIERCWGREIAERVSFLVHDPPPSCLPALASTHKWLTSEFMLNSYLRFFQSTIDNATTGTNLTILTGAAKF